MKVAPRKLSYVPCECGTAEHFLCIAQDFDDPDELNVSFLSTRNGSFWHRVKWAWLHVFRSQDLVFADIIIKRDAWTAALPPRETE